MATNDDTIYGGNAQPVVEESRNESNQNNGPSWQQIAIGGVAGILMGAGAMYAANAMKTETKPDETEAEEVKPEDTAATEDNTDGKDIENLNVENLNIDNVNVAHVNGDISFGEAFAAARAEVGPGGVFHWHGNVYNTYTVEEWNSMTITERNIFASHVSPLVHHHPHHHIHHHDTIVHEHVDIIDHHVDVIDHHHIDHHDHVYDHHHDHVHDVHDIHDIHDIHDVHDMNVEDVHPSNSSPVSSPDIDPITQVTGYGNEVTADNSVSIDNSVHQDQIQNTDDSEVHVLGMDHVKLGDDATMNIGRNIINADDVVIMNVNNSPVYDTTPQDAPSHIESNVGQSFHDKDMSIDDFAQAANGYSSAPDYSQDMMADSQDHMADSMPDYTNDADV